MKRIPHWLWIVLIAGAARLINLGQEALWYDETFTNWVASFDLSKLLTVVRGDVHPPLFYLVEWVNVRILGNSEFALRLPSALLSIAACLLLWRIALALEFPPNTALVAGVLAALMPAAIYYGQEARMYALLTVMVFVMVLGAIRHSWVMVIVGAVGTVYSQNLGVFYVGAVLSVLVLQRQFRNRAIIAAIAIFILWIPQGLILIDQARSVASSFWTPPTTLGTALWPLNGLILGWRMPSALMWASYTAGFGGSLVGLINSRKWLITPNGLIVLSAVITAPALCLLVSAAWKPIFADRAFLPSTTLLMLVWAYAFNHLSAANRSTYRKVVIPALVVGLISHYFPTQPRSNWREIAAKISDRWQAGDVVYYVALDAPLVLNYYLNEPYLMSDRTGDRNKSIQSLAFQYFNVGSYQEAVEQSRHVWVVITTASTTAQNSVDEIEQLPLSAGEQVYKESRRNTRVEVYRMRGLQWQQSPAN